MKAEQEGRLIELENNFSRAESSEGKQLALEKLDSFVRNMIASESYDYEEKSRLEQSRSRYLGCLISLESDLIRKRILAETLTEIVDRAYEEYSPRFAASDSMTRLRSIVRFMNYVRHVFLAGEENIESDPSLTRCAILYREAKKIFDEDPARN